MQEVLEYYRKTPVYLGKNSCEQFDQNQGEKLHVHVDTDRT